MLFGCVVSMLNIIVLLYCPTIGSLCIKRVKSPALFAQYRCELQCQQSNLSHCFMSSPVCGSIPPKQWQCVTVWIKCTRKRLFLNHLSLLLFHILLLLKLFSLFCFSRVYTNLTPLKFSCLCTSWFGDEHGHDYTTIHEGVSLQTVFDLDLICVSSSSSEGTISLGM